MKASLGSMDYLSLGWLLAAGEDKGLNPLDLAPPFILIAVVFYFLLYRPQRREQATREAMLSALKKNDKVVTIGGILGSVANISTDGQEVTLKVDDDTRIKFIRSSIQRVVSSEGDAEKPAESK